MPALWQHAARLIALGDIGRKVGAFFSTEPDHALVKARAKSERLVALVRLGIIIALVASSLAFALSTPSILIYTVLVGSGALAYGVLLLWFSQRITAPWFPWVTSGLDVSLISSNIFGFLLLGAPLLVVNNKVAFDTYFVAITISALRYDWRLSAFTTALALAEFGGMSLYVALHWDLPTLAVPGQASFYPAPFLNRFLILLGHGAAVVAVAQWARHLRLMIGTDHLTGLLQRRPFLERVEEELGRADPSRSILSVAVFDVDEFKRFNDSFGHLAGDRALEAIAGELRLAVRTTDLVARYGGEEFVIAFPRMDVQLALERVNNLCRRVGELELGPSAERLTLSAGVASWPADGADFESVLDMADQRLYTAKRSGRNLVVGPLPVAVPSRIAPAN